MLFKIIYFKLLYLKSISFCCMKYRMYDVKVFLTFGADLTTVLPVLFKYCCKYCYSDSRKL